MKTTLFAVSLLMSSLAVNAQSSSAPGQSPNVETVAEFGKHQPIGVGVSKERRIFITFPKKPENYDYGLAEIVNLGNGPGQRKPYPNAEWNQWDSTKPKDRFMNVQALFVDKTNALWVLDPGNPGEEATIPDGVKLMKINLANDQVEKIFRFEDLPREKTALNDVRIDTEHQFAYLSDPKRATIVVLDLKTGKSRNLLQDDKSTKADPEFKLKIDGKEVKDDKGKSFSSKVNGIALTDDFKYFYYRAINQTKLYRIETQYLRNPDLSPAEVAKHVEEVAETGVSHGMTSDAKGNVYLTDSPNKAVRYLTPDRKLETLAKDSRFLWPDSFAVGWDGYLYMTAAQIHRTKKYNDGHDKVDYPFRLYRMKLPN
ncbi:major royal jelly family protein [Spirosoma sp. KUDC1026]|uniref:major royal jelly family protein n=1 Tax=Spirosoma sp. KUDC1026 TaxID=2745947 RepID=UPI001E4A269F|nr:major royal jelly family protein [Spirosoma sp. KUDC1026]